MSDILNLRIGNSIPTKILQDDVLKQQGNNNLDWFKVANDAGGYYCRGIFVQPSCNAGGYLWYWDLNCQSGIKDNGDWNQFGFIFDGNNKNITEGMALPFPNINSWDESSNNNWYVNICIIVTTPNEEELILDQPITIDFVNDRYDGCIMTAGKNSNISANKRTITIYKLVNGWNQIVKIYGENQWTKQELETNL